MQVFNKYVTSGKTPMCFFLMNHPSGSRCQLKMNKQHTVPSLRSNPLTRLENATDEAKLEPVLESGEGEGCEGGFLVGVGNGHEGR